MNLPFHQLRALWRFDQDSFELLHYLNDMMTMGDAPNQIHVTKKSLLIYPD